ncbi:hypothetical protein Sarmat_00621 [Rickettsiales endosymbiont of Paramecium tredecaurelia]|uniref:hypothetical protein n=1 Tax=Candidatus Sarmatiella mevalonica TaxID=2770581 RepID=UPI00192095B8|nr:hypothetical protein [Candidatus Sarmatiella mevalonica]MBL3284765.1 hypothetical protein [Candidatus Sarmatiella mevalonica]
MMIAYNRAITRARVGEEPSVSYHADKADTAHAFTMLARDGSAPEAYSHVINVSSSLPKIKITTSINIACYIKALG